MEKLKKIFQVLLLVCLFVIPGCRRVEYRSVQPENSDMKYLLFPAESYQNTLKRAIIVSGEELYSDGRISYYAGDNEVWCDKSNFSLWPDAQQDELVKLLNDELVKWGKETDYDTMDAVSIECQRILQGLNINSNTTQKEAIIRINRYLCENSYYEYDESKRDGYPYASIMNEGKVCHNYALAFQMLCLHAGIECEYYASDTMNHAWNKVYCSDGTYYWVDVCWNDGKDITKYLLLTTEQLLTTHSL